MLLGIPTDLQPIINYLSDHHIPYTYTENGSFDYPTIYIGARCDNVKTYFDEPSITFYVDGRRYDIREDMMPSIHTIASVIHYTGDMSLKLEFNP
jgi:hypothetical protein